MATVFSGIQPTGELHIGNYLGALRNWVRLQDEYPCYFCIVDYHAMTAPYSPADMPTRVFNLEVELLAVGLDPARCVLFVQSEAPEHTELTWILNCIASVGALERMTQFKDKSEQLAGNVNMGLFDYPVLQTADILLYKADRVPVGDDQLQHLELSRELTRRFNHRFGETFPEPAALLTKAPRVMSLSDPTAKMSKSIPGSYIGMTDDDEEIRRKIGRAVTDTGPRGEQMSPGVANLFMLLDELAPPETAAHFHAQYEAGTLRYSELKPAIAEAIIAVFAPISERRRALLAEPERVREIFAAGAETARAVARETMAEVRERVGIRGA